MPETITIDGITFRHVLDKDFETYFYDDQNGWQWAVWQHQKGGKAIRSTWFASVAQPGVNTPVRMLNTCTCWHGERPDEADPLYHIPADKPEPLLIAMVPLIQKGEWPT